MADKIIRSNNVFFKIGVILVVFCSFTIGFFNISIFFIGGIPIFGLLLGIIFVWISKASTGKKWISTFVPFSLIPASFFLFYLCLPKAEPEAFLIPDDFRGYIVVVFEEDCGQSIVYEEGRRIYDFSRNGLLITNSKMTFGVIDRKFYAIDEKGMRTEMPQYHWSSLEEEKKDWHWLFSSSRVSKEKAGIFWAYRNDYSFIVSDYESMEKQDTRAKEAAQKLLQNQLEAALTDCRQRS